MNDCPPQVYVTRDGRRNAWYSFSAGGGAVIMSGFPNWAECEAAIRTWCHPTEAAEMIRRYAPPLKPKPLEDD